MQQLLIIVYHNADSPGAQLNFASACSWCSDNRRVQVWIWGERIANENEKELKFTIRSAFDASLEACPYVKVQLDRFGEGTVEQDPLGLHPLYVGAHGHATFISNSPHRIAEALTSVQGAPVPKCLSLSAYLVSCQRPIGIKTGFEGIRCTPYATRLVITSTHQLKYVQLPTPWNAEFDVLDGREVDSVIDRCVSEMATNLGSRIARANRKVWLPLTGGYDSRLVLALAIEAGVLSEVNLRTGGADDHPDVVIAGQIAQRLQLHHTVTHPKPIAESLRTRVHRTAGALCLRLGSGPTSPSSLLLNGLIGEAFRSNVRTRLPLQNREQVITCWLGAQAQSGLLRREAQIAALTEGMEGLLSPLEEGVRPEMAMDVFYVQHLMRRWISTRPEMFTNVALPLYCPMAIQLALGMGWAARRTGFLHETVVARVGGPLVDVPYAQGKEPRAVPTLTQLGISSESPKTLEPREIATLWHDQKLVRRRPSHQAVGPALSEEREKEVQQVQAEYREYVEETSGSPIWDVVDREKVREAVDCMPRLRDRARYELDAAITGVLWHST